MKTPDEAILVLEEVRKYFPLPRRVFRRRSEYIKAVDGVTFSINREDVFGLVGESGSGKSTLGYTLVRIYRPTAGKISFLGKDITRISRRELKGFKKEMQIVFQDPGSSLNPRRTIEQTLELPLKIHKIDGEKDRRSRIRELLSVVGLPSVYMQKYPSALSGGQKQRVAIASALVNQPQVVLADEPTGNVDPATGEGILQLFKELNQDLGTSFFIVTHSQLVASKSDRILEIRDGIIIGQHDAGATLRDLDTTRVLELDEQNRLPIPTHLLLELNNPRRFAATTEDETLILTPRSLSAISDEDRFEIVTCRVCGRQAKPTMTFCEHCGSTL